ncbi:MAG: DNA alkylation repair protein [Cyanobacteria bacterium P01_A01_bin.40]
MSWGNFLPLISLASLSFISLSILVHSQESELNHFCNRFPKNSRYPTYLLLQRCCEKSNQEYHALIETIINDLVQEQHRFIQTGIGWVMADMSKIFPKRVEAWFRKYLPQLDREFINRHIRHLLCHRELKQLKKELSMF